MRLRLIRQASLAPPAQHKYTLRLQPALHAGTHLSLHARTTHYTHLFVHVCVHRTNSTRHTCGMWWCCVCVCVLCGGAPMIFNGTIEKNICTARAAACGVCTDTTRESGTLVGMNARSMTPWRVACHCGVIDKRAKVANARAHNLKDWCRVVSRLHS